MLTPKQEKFVYYYVREADPKKAIDLAGYSRKNSSDQLKALLLNPDITLAIDEERRSYAKEEGWDKDYYVSQTLKHFKECKSESVKAKYWQMIGQCFGHFQPDTNPSTPINQTFFNMDTSKMEEREKEARARLDKATNSSEGVDPNLPAPAQDPHIES